MFKNLTVFVMPKGWKTTAQQLGAALAPQAFKPAGQLEPQSIGWVPVRPSSEDLVHVVNRQFLLRLKIEKKVLPGAAINEVVKERAQELEEQQGFPPGKKQVKELKEQVTDELLARALSVSKDVLVWIDPVNGLLVVDTPTPNKAEEVLKLLFKAVDKFPAETLATQMSPAAAMTDWLAADEAPHGFTVDDEAELCSTAESKATVKFVRHTLEAADIRRHIESGKQCIKLAMTWGDKISFVLTDKLVIKSVVLLDVLKEDTDASGKNDDERFDGEFMLVSGELAKLIAGVIEALGGKVKQELAEAA
jgi:recombination associated protein RdgC